MFSRKYYLDECKKKANNLIKSGNPRNALVTFLLDIGKNNDTYNQRLIDRGTRILFADSMSVEDAKRFIDEFI